MRLELVPFIITDGAVNITTVNITIRLAGCLGGEGWDNVFYSNLRFSHHAARGCFGQIQENNPFTA